MTALVRLVQVLPAPLAAPPVAVTSVPVLRAVDGWLSVAVAEPPPMASALFGFVNVTADAAVGSSVLLPVSTPTSAFDGVPSMFNALLGVEKLDPFAVRGFQVCGPVTTFPVSTAFG